MLNYLPKEGKQSKLSADLEFLGDHMVEVKMFPEVVRTRGLCRRVKLVMNMTLDGGGGMI